MNKIKKMREQLNMRQEDLAKKIKVDRSSIAKWETGESKPRADKLPVLAGILGCSIDELLA